MLALARTPQSMSAIRLAPQVLVEELERPLPGELGGGLVISRCRVVVEAVLRTRILVHRVRDVAGLERSLVSGPAGVDALVVLRVVNEQGRLALHGIRDGGRGAVEGDSRGKIEQARRQHVCDSATVAETGHADLAGAVGPGLQDC